MITGLFILVAAVALLLASARDDQRARAARTNQHTKEER